MPRIYLNTFFLPLIGESMTITPDIQYIANFFMFLPL